jgi:hypothetical protein
MLFDLYHKGNFDSKVVPLVNSSVGVSRVSVTGISFGEGSWVPQSAQKWEVSGFSVSHLGHFMTHHPYFLAWQKNIIEFKKSQFLIQTSSYVTVV